MLGTNHSHYIFDVEVGALNYRYCCYDTYTLVRLLSFTSGELHGTIFFTVVGNKPGTPIIPISVCDYLGLCSATSAYT